MASPTKLDLVSLAILLFFFAFSELSIVCVIIFSSFSIGIHDPNNRIFVKTFNQISNQQFTNKEFDFKKDNFEKLFKKAWGIYPYIFVRNSNSIF